MNQLCHPNVIVFTAAKNITIQKEIFSIKELALIIASNASIIGISESKLDSTVLNREVDIVSYDEGGKSCMLQ